MGALGVGPLIGGCLAQWARWPLTLSYLVFLALGAIGLAGLAFVPETGTPTPRTVTAKQPSGSRRSKLPIPAAAGTLAAFAASGLFAGLAGLILSVTLGYSSHALAGATLFLVFSCGVAPWRRRPGCKHRVLALGTMFMSRAWYSSWLLFGSRTRT